MNLQSLRTFMIAGEAESLTLAAEVLLYAQSTVTTQIKQLEAEWGVELFRKEGRGVRLTPEGRALLAKVRVILRNVDALELVVSGIQEGGAGHLRIGAMEPVGSWKVAPLLAQFTRNRPLLQINYETGSSYSLTERMEHHELEIAITHQPRLDSKVAFEPLYTEHNAILLREEHPLAQKELLQLDDLRSVRLIFQDTAWAYRGVNDHELVYYGRDYAFANIELNSIEAMIAFVQAGIGVAVLPEYCVTPLPAGCVLRFVEGQPFERTFGMLHSIKGRYPVIVEEVMDLLRRQLK